MLQIIRNWTKGWLAIVIVGLLVIPFAFVGVNYYFGQGGAISAISINGTDISLREYQKAYQNIRQQWQAMSENTSPDGIEDVLKQQTVETLIQRELLKQTHEKIGLRVSNTEVQEAIERLEYFSGIDGFDRIRYESALAQLGMTPVSFEAQIRQDILTEQLQLALVGSAFVTGHEVDQIASLSNQARDVTYALISSDAAKESITVSEEDISNYYQERTDQFMEPEKVRIAYIVLSQQKISEGVDVDEDSIRNYYENNADTYNEEQERKINQLLVKVSDESSTDIKSKAQQIAAEVKSLLEDGNKLSEIAEKYPDTGDVTVEFSEFGFLTKGVMEAEVDEVAFNLAEGGVSDPVQSKLGLHIIHVEEIKGGQILPFEEVQSDVEQDYRLYIAEKQFYELTDQMAALTYEQPDTLELAAEDLGLAVQESDFFSREQPGTGIISDAKVVATSFSDEVLREGNNSDVIELDNNRNMVLRVLEHKPEMRKALDEVKERIITRIKFERAQQKTRVMGQEIIEKLKQGTDRESLAAEYSLDWQVKTEIKRDDPGTNRAILRTAFRLGKPEAGEVKIGGVSLGTGDYAVVIINKVSDVSTGDLAEQDLENVKSQLLRVKADSSWLQLTEDKKESADIEVYTETL